jgi:hypothetical protein
MIQVPFHRLFGKDVFVNFDAVSPAKNKTKRNRKNSCKKSAGIKPSRGARNRPVSLITEIGRHRMDGQEWKCFSYS